MNMASPRLHFLVWLWAALGCSVQANVCFYKECRCPFRNIMCDDLGLTSVPLPQTEVPYGSVVTLSLTGNQISNIPAGRLPPGLKNLDLSQNPILDIEPAALDNCSDSLMDISFGNAAFTRLPAALAHLSAVRMLYMTDTHITDWNQFFSEHQSTLQLLHLENVGLNAWPDWFQMLSNLTRVTLARDMVDTVPVGAFTNVKDILVTLTLSFPRLSHVPQALSELTNLQELTLTNCSISQLSNIPPTSSLDLRYNAISNATDVARALQPSNRTLSTLYLEWNNLIQIPDLRNFTALTSVYLSVNKISDPAHGGFSPSVTVLALDENQLPGIPTAVAAMTALVELRLAENQITEIGTNSFPVQLETLDLSANNISQLSMTSFGNHPAIRELDLSNNPLTLIRPGTFSHLQTLTKIRLSHTNITSIPLDLSTSISLLDMTHIPHLDCPCPVPPQLLAWYNPGKLVSGQCKDNITIQDYLSGAACGTATWPTSTTSTTSTSSTTWSTSTSSQPTGTTGTAAGKGPLLWSVGLLLGTGWALAQ